MENNHPCLSAMPKYGLWRVVIVMSDMPKYGVCHIVIVVIVMSAMPKYGVCQLVDLGQACPNMESAALS